MSNSKGGLLTKQNLPRAIPNTWRHTKETGVVSLLMLFSCFYVCLGHQIIS